MNFDNYRYLFPKPGKLYKWTLVKSDPGTVKFVLVIRVSCMHSYAGGRTYTSVAIKFLDEEKIKEVFCATIEDNGEVEFSDKWEEVEDEH